jgi:hypothetical protein
MGYTNPFIWRYAAKTADAAAPWVINTDLDLFLIEPNREVFIHSIYAFVLDAAPASTTAIKLIDTQGATSDLVLATINIGTVFTYPTPLLADKLTPATFPIRIPARPVNNTLVLRNDAAVDATTAVVIHIRLTGV